MEVQVGDAVEYYSKTYDTWISTTVHAKDNVKGVVLYCHRKNMTWTKLKPDRVRLQVAAPAPAPEPAFLSERNFQVGDRVEVFSKSSQDWCPGKISRLQGSNFVVDYRKPGDKQKWNGVLAPSSGSLRYPESEGLPPRTPPMLPVPSPVRQPPRGSSASGAGREASSHRDRTSSIQKQQQAMAAAEGKMLHARKLGNAMNAAKALKSQRQIEKDAKEKQKRKHEEKERQRKEQAEREAEQKRVAIRKAKERADHAGVSKLVNKDFTNPDEKMMSELFPTDDENEGAGQRAQKRQRDGRQDMPAEKRRRELKQTLSASSAEKHARARRAPAELPPQTPMDAFCIESKPKPAKPGAKSQARLSGATPASSSSAPPKLEPLNAQEKQALQLKIDELNDDALETVLKFLESDLGDPDQEEINLDLDKLTPQRAQDLVKVVREELAKQKKAEEEAKAPPGKSPPQSPVYDLGKDIVTPLLTARQDPPVSPMQLEPSQTAAATKCQIPIPTGSPTPFPTPSENGDEHHERVAAAAQIAKSPAIRPSVPSVAVSPAPSAGQSAGVEEAISKSIRKAVRMTPELTESKTPRHTGPSSSPKSERPMEPDSMLGVVDEAMLSAMEGEMTLSASSKPTIAADVAATADAPMVMDNAATTLSTISGEKS